MADYSKQISTALRLITKYGGPITLLMAPVTVEDPDNLTPWRDDGSAPVEIPHVGVVFPYEGAQAEARPWSEQLLMPAGGLVFPGTTDPVSVSKEMFFRDAAGDTWQIKDAQRLAPDMVSTILWDCDVVRWPQRL